MQFTILDRFQRHPDNARSHVFLVWDNWNDYSFHTLFGIFYIDAAGNIIDLGSIKIGYFGQETGFGILSIGDSFNELDKKFFSLGQSEDYYETLNNLGEEIRDEILLALRDIAKSVSLYNRAVKQEVTKVSLLRNVSPTTVIGQFRRIASGGARSTDYRFKFEPPKLRGRTSAMELTFDVIPESFPPSNIHVIIGRNGVGKTFLINNMINSLTSNKKQHQAGKFTFYENEYGEGTFANLISVTFSAFDESEPRPEIRDKTIGISYSYIGLKRISVEKDSETTKSSAMLNTEFYKSLWACKAVSKAKRWKDAVTMLESDPNFKESEIKQLIDIEEEEILRPLCNEIFKRLSSGHKVVLLTITRLISVLQERSLVLIDEPEAHLHPPLLSAFIRALSELLAVTNGVAIIATHSPVILQEVPKNCVWKLRRTGSEAKAERLTIESFGENVGILTHEIFGLEVTNSGFYNILEEVVEQEKYYENVMIRFNNQLGMEARAIVRSLCEERN
jgi:predicted ATPase